ncbi:MAG: hypothetical protein V4640_10245 [Verrucomicrobiota bacterium]
MSSPPDTPAPKAVIPESLRVQLDGFRRHLWRVKILEAVAAGLIGLLVSFLLVYGLDRVWQTPGWARLAILAGGVSLFGIFAPFWLHRWVWRQRREEQLARLIARRYPGLGDRLLGVIELQQQQGNADTLSPRLREAAMEAVAAETGKRKLSEALPPQRHRRWSLAALGLAGVAAAAFFVTPRAGWNALERWLMPFSKTERYTFTRLEHAPVYRAVAFGEAFEITLRLAKDSDQKPGEASGRFGVQVPVETTLAGDVYHFTFPGQQDGGVIRFRVGDLRHEMRIEPVARPAVESSLAVLRSPDYLGVPERTVDMATGAVSAVEGSRVILELKTTRPLVDGSFGPTRVEGREDASGNHVPLQGKLAIAGRQARTAELAVGAEPFEVPFSWTDEFGLAGDAGFRLRIDGMRDAAPTCYLQGIERQKVMLPEETVDFEVLTEDDFGVKRAGIEWSGQFTRPTDEAPAKGEIQLQEGGPEQRRVMVAAAFSPGAYGITPQKITLRGYTEDYFPQRERVYSEPVTLYVLTRDEHAQMLKNRFDRNLTEFEDLARREQELLDENQRLEKLDGEELQQEENAKRLEDQEQAEAESTRRMKDLTERMEELMKDAARNGDIEKETLRKMAESLKSMQELSQQDLPAVGESLEGAQDPANTQEKTEKDVAEAVEQQKKAVEKMKDAIEKANDANRKFEAGTFVNRLKKAAGEQNSIASSLIDGFDRMLGVKNSQLDPSDERRLGEAALQQANTASDVRWIQEDLGSYFARTSTEVFRQILDEMRESQIDSRLEGIRSLLAANHSFTATEDAKKWADKLTEWAKKLEGDKDGGGGGGGGGGESPEDEDFEFMLRVMKLVQQEQDIRAQTRALEQLRRSAAEKPQLLRKP